MCIQWRDEECFLDHTKSRNSGLFRIYFLLNNQKTLKESFQLGDAIFVWRHNISHILIWTNNDNCSIVRVDAVWMVCISRIPIEGHIVCYSSSWVSMLICMNCDGSIKTNLRKSSSSRHNQRYPAAGRLLESHPIRWSSWRLHEPVKPQLPPWPSPKIDTRNTCARSSGRTSGTRRTLSFPLLDEELSWSHHRNILLSIARQKRFDLKDSSLYHRFRRPHSRMETVFRWDIS